jgi:RimJ/RimL family protein N-acetyltransferase
VADWAFRTHNLVPTKYDAAIGIAEPDGRLVGAILFQNFNGNNLELSYYGRRTLTPGIVKTVAQAAVAYNPSRLTAVTGKKNRRLLRFLQRLGFKLEGAQRRYYGMRDCPRSTGVRLVMFREQLDRIAGNQNQGSQRTLQDKLQQKAFVRHNL